jgi:hypothetical protein
MAYIHWGEETRKVSGRTLGILVVQQSSPLLCSTNQDDFVVLPFLNLVAGKLYLNFIALQLNQPWQAYNAPKVISMLYVWLLGRHYFKHSCQALD